MIRLLLQVAFALLLVSTPLIQGALEITGRMGSSQSEEKHEKPQAEVESRVTRRVSPPPAPIRSGLAAPRLRIVVNPRWAPSEAPSLQFDRYSERRLI